MSTTMTTDDDPRPRQQQQQQQPRLSFLQRLERVLAASDDVSAGVVHDHHHDNVVVRQFEDDGSNNHDNTSGNHINDANLHDAQQQQHQQHAWQGLTAESRRHSLFVSPPTGPMTNSRPSSSRTLTTQDDLNHHHHHHPQEQHQQQHNPVHATDRGDSRDDDDYHDDDDLDGLLGNVGVGSAIGHHNTMSSSIRASISSTSGGGIGGTTYGEMDFLSLTRNHRSRWSIIDVRNSGPSSVVVAGAMAAAAAADDDSDYIEHERLELVPKLTLPTATQFPPTTKNDGIRTHHGTFEQDVDEESDSNKKDFWKLPSVSEPATTTTTAPPPPPKATSVVVSSLSFTSWRQQLSPTYLVSQVPAIAVTSLLSLLTAIPFGVAYFPIDWVEPNQLSNNEQEHVSTTTATDVGGGTGGTFPLPGRNDLGIRMCLFATMIGQSVLTFTSGFDSSVSFQLLENVPFYQAMADMIIAEIGYGRDALATLFFVFGLSSFTVGVMFYALGKFKLGRIVYFFPSHVLVGCIGGIGVFVFLAAVEVTNNQEFTWNMAGVQGMWENRYHFGVVLVLEIILRILNRLLSDAKGNPKVPLLAPIFFCAIVPIFYFSLWILGLDVETAKEAGYFFPASAAKGDVCDESGICVAPTFWQRVFDGHVLDIFHVMDLSLVSWSAVIKTFPTVIACALFSLLQVPINIPAFAISSNVDVDMNRELIAHGYSNAVSGLFGGLQNVMTYSYSVLYHKSGGKGPVSSLILVAMTGVLFLFGPQCATLIPRCMAGTLLAHIGVDLFLEGVYDSYENYDSLEYAGILVIASVMTFFGMTAALVAGLIAAMMTYAVQSIQQQDPIFRIMTASTLRSSAWYRTQRANAILDDEHRGRARILVVQLQGHLFFGNAAQLTESIYDTLATKKGSMEQPRIVILDFTLVVGLDSSAAHSIVKLKNAMHKNYAVEVTMFVTGSHRGFFPCQYKLTEALESATDKETWDWVEVDQSFSDPAQALCGSISVTPGSKSMLASDALRTMPRRAVCTSLDEALVFAEDVLIARQDPALLIRDKSKLSGPFDSAAYDFLNDTSNMTLDEERSRAIRFIENLAPPTLEALQLHRAVLTIVELCKRETYQQHDIVWRQGDDSVCLKVVVRGSFRAYLEGTDITEDVKAGAMMGELGLVQGSRRLSTVRCTSEQDAVVYSLYREEWEQLLREELQAARVIDQIVIRFLAQRVQHVSNRILETKCLPI